MSKRSRAMVVLGSHRSGTSVLTRVLSELGAAAPGGLLEPSPDNPDGYFESRRIVQLNNEVLRVGGLTWFHDGPLPGDLLGRRRVLGLRRQALAILREEFEGQDIFVLKDPRISRLVPFWASVLEELGVDTHWVLMLRHPEEVSRSLDRRRNMPAQSSAAVTAIGQAHLLWLRYTLEAERDTRKLSWTLLTFEELLADWRGALDRICAAGPGRLPGLDDPDCIARIDELVSPGRRNSKVSVEEELSGRMAWTVWIFEELSAHAQGRAPLPEVRVAAALEALDRSHAAFLPLRGDGLLVRTSDPWGGRQLDHAMEQVERLEQRGSGQLPRHVLLVAEDPGARSVQYRIDNHAAALAGLGVDCTSLPRSEVDLVEEAAGQSDVVVLHRTPWAEDLGSLISSCRKRGVPVVLDIDDLIFDPERMNPRHFGYLSELSEADRQQWGELSRNLRETLEAVDLAVLPTVALAGEARAAGKPALVLPSGLGARALECAARARRRRLFSIPRRSVRIGYASGTPTHRRDFALAAGAVAHCLEVHPHASFTALGFLEPDDYPELIPFRSRIEQRPAVPLARLPHELARFDVNLAPLEAGNPFCEAKSELKYFEAAAVGIPTLASATETYRRAIQDGVNGRLASSPEEWVAALDELVGNAALRRQLGRSARSHALGLHGPEETRRQVELLHRWIQARAKSHS